MTAIFFIIFHINQFVSGTIPKITPTGKREHLPLRSEPHWLWPRGPWRRLALLHVRLARHRHGSLLVQVCKLRIGHDV
jgi:hypothetical protein